jgi:hypothetical protein
MAHGSGDAQTAVQVAFAALVASRGLDDERAVLYSDWIRIALGKAARAALEQLMETRGYEFQSEFARKHDALGREKGRAEGKAEGKAESVLGILEERGLSVSTEQRERILTTTDLETLDGWIRKAVRVSSTEALFE